MEPDQALPMSNSMAAKDGLTTSERAQIRRLRRKNKQLLAEEATSWQKAAAWFTWEIAAAIVE